MINQVRIKCYRLVIQVIKILAFKIFIIHLELAVTRQHLHFPAIRQLILCLINKQSNVHRVSQIQTKTARHKLNSSISHNIKIYSKIFHKTSFHIPIKLSSPLSNRFALFLKKKRKLLLLCLQLKWMYFLLNSSRFQNS